MGDESELGDRQMRMVYLVTYSQANEAICSSRQQFADKLLTAFNAASIPILHWACCRETHIDGGKHYHMAIRLEKVRRWMRVKQFLINEYNMVVNFSATHANYYTAYEYVTKEDENVLHSPCHPDLGDHRPRSTAASTKRMEASCSRQNVPPPRKRKRLSAYDVSQIAVERNIKTRTQLLALAEQQKTGENGPCGVHCQ